MFLPTLNIQTLSMLSTSFSHFMGLKFFIMKITENIELKVAKKSKSI